MTSNYDKLITDDILRICKDNSLTDGFGLTDEEIVQLYDFLRLVQIDNKDEYAEKARKATLLTPKLEPEAMIFEVRCNFLSYKYASCRFIELEESFIAEKYVLENDVESLQKHIENEKFAYVDIFNALSLDALFTLIHKRNLNDFTYLSWALELEKFRNKERYPNLSLEERRKIIAFMEVVEKEGFSCDTQKGWIGIIEKAYDIARKTSET